MNIAVSNRLNLIRITAAWFVLLGHGLSLCSLTVFRNDAVFPYMQNIGVVLLFFISGFLNTHSNERKKVRMGGGWTIPCQQILPDISSVPCRSDSCCCFRYAFCLP